MVAELARTCMQAEFDLFENITWTLHHMMKLRVSEVHRLYTIGLDEHKKPSVLSYALINFSGYFPFHSAVLSASERFLITITCM